MLRVMPVVLIGAIGILLTLWGVSGGLWGSRPAEPLPTMTTLPYQSLTDHLTAGTIREIAPLGGSPVPFLGIDMSPTATPGPRDVTEIEQPHAWCYARGTEPLVCVLKEGARN